MMITLYKKQDCPHCTAALDYFLRNEIAFEEVDVMEDENALNFLRSRGHTTVPQFYIGDKLLVTGGNTGIQAMTKEQIMDIVNNMTFEVA